jgi:hypothetical protein
VSQSHKRIEETQPVARDVVRLPLGDMAAHPRHVRLSHMGCYDLFPALDGETGSTRPCRRPK